MTDLEHREYILRQLKVNYSVKVTELSKQLFIGEATIRRDLKKLENGGYLRRVYGGAVRLDTVDRELPTEVRLGDNRDAKADLCAAAAALIQDGSVVSMDSSTTVLGLAAHLEGFSNLTILTQGQTLVDQLRYGPFNIYCSGGLLQKTTLSYNGTFARKFFSSFCADIAFISCKGLSMEHGISWAYEEEACLRQIMLENAKYRVLLCDSSKFDQVAPCKLFGFSHIDCLVTDRRPSPEWVSFLRSKNVELLYP